MVKYENLFLKCNEEELIYLKHEYDMDNDCYYGHHSFKITTETIPDLTLQELAQYVINNKPLIQKENVKVRKEYR